LNKKQKALDTCLNALNNNSAAIVTDDFGDYLLFQIASLYNQSEEDMNNGHERRKALEYHLKCLELRQFQLRHQQLHLKEDEKKRELIIS
jgi:hypothetical protein